MSYAQVWILALTSVALQMYQQQTLHVSFCSIYCIYTLKVMLAYIQMIQKLPAK